MAVPNWAPQEYIKVNVFGIERADGGAGLPRVHTKAPLPELVLADPPGIEQGHPALIMHSGVNITRSSLFFGTEKGDA